MADIKAITEYLEGCTDVKAIDCEGGTVLIFPKGKETPPFVLEALNKAFQPMELTFSEYRPSGVELVICREGRVGDFSALARLAGGLGLKEASYSGSYELNKGSLVRLSGTLGFEEICDANGRFCAPKDAKRGNDFKVGTPLYALAANSGLLDTDIDNNVLPGKRAPELLSMQPHEMAKQIFEDYLSDNRIYEVHYIPYMAVNDGENSVRWSECRKPIVELLKKCPVDRFVPFDEFNAYAKLYCSDFFRKQLTGAVMIKGLKLENSDAKDRYYQPTEWGECEAPLIRLILSFLSAIGLLDVAYGEDIRRFEHNRNGNYVGITGFRITKLGAWVLGLTDSYEATESNSSESGENSLVVRADFTVVITGLKCRIEHEAYLSKFLTKMSADENTAAYRLDFPSTVRALNAKITPLKLKKYLEKASGKPLPENVGHSLDEWQAEVGRIKLRTVTLVEADDELLLDKIKAIKGMGAIITGEVKIAISIDRMKENKAKKLMEKNGWLVETDWLY